MSGVAAHPAKWAASHPYTPRRLAIRSPSHCWRDSQTDPDWVELVRMLLCVQQQRMLSPEHVIARDMEQTQPFVSHRTAFRLIYNSHG